MRFVPVLVFLLAACASTPGPDLTAQYAAMPTAQLWSLQQTTQSSRDLAFIEAELGYRGQVSFGRAFLGQRTVALLGRATFPRDAGETAGVDDRDCDSFPGAAAAQRFFLKVGGPESDRHRLDADGDGFACEWGAQLRRIAARRPAPARASYRPPASATCHVGPRGGTYTITASGAKDYDGC